jgi:hypothetical protein
MAGNGGRGRSGVATAARPVATATTRAASTASTGVVLPDGVTMSERFGDREYQFTQGPDRISFNVAEPNALGANVLFRLNGSVSRDAARGTREDRLRTGLRVGRIMRADAASRPDGFRYYTSAATGDGAGAARVKLYTKAGFSSPEVVGGIQYAVVRNGVLTPAGAPQTGSRSRFSATIARANDLLSAENDN